LKTNELQLAWFTVFSVQSTLLPLLALTYQLVEPAIRPGNASHPEAALGGVSSHGAAPGSTTNGQQQQQQQQQQQISNMASGVQSDTTTAAAAPAGGSSIQAPATDSRKGGSTNKGDSNKRLKSRPQVAPKSHRLAAAICSGTFVLITFFATLSDDSQEALDFGKQLVRMVRERLALVAQEEGTSDTRSCHDQANPIHEAMSVLMTLEQGTSDTYEAARHSTNKSASLNEFLSEQHWGTWQDAWAGQYRPKEEALHARLLDQYAKAAAERAAQQQPSLAADLQRIITGRG
jgi:hypothetical protein